MKDSHFEHDEQITLNLTRTCRSEKVFFVERRLQNVTASSKMPRSELSKILEKVDLTHLTPASDKLHGKRWKMGAGTSKGGSKSSKQPFLLSAQVQSFLSSATYAQLISYACISHTSPLLP